MPDTPTVLVTVGVVVPVRHFYKTGFHFAAVLAVTTCLTACAGMNVPFYGKVGEKAPVAETVDVPGASQAAPVAVAPLDPINAAPPSANGTANTATAQNDALLVPAPSAMPKNDGSQRVPLGSLNAPAP